MQTNVTFLFYYFVLSLTTAQFVRETSGPFYPVDNSKYRDSIFGKKSYKTQDCVRCNRTAAVCCKRVTMLKFYSRNLCGAIQVTKSNLVNMEMLLDDKVEQKITDPLKVVIKEDRKPVCAFYDPFFKVKACFHVYGAKVQKKTFSANVKLSVNILNYQFADIPFHRLTLSAPTSNGRHF